MKCITFGWMIVLVIIMSVAFSFLPAPVGALGGIVTFGIFCYWVAGFFLKCDSPGY